MRGLKLNISNMDLIFLLIQLVFFFIFHQYDKIRPYHVRRKDTKDTVGRYIVLIPEVKADSCQHDSE